MNTLPLRVTLAVALSLGLAACSSSSTTPDVESEGPCGISGVCGSPGAGQGGSEAGGSAGATAAGQGGSDVGGQGGSPAGGSAPGGAGGSEVGGSAGASAGAAGAAGGVVSGTFACEGGQKIAAGLNNNWMAGGKARSFYADFPKDQSKPMGVVFWFHGYGDTAKNWQSLAPSPDLDPEFPVVVITPEDTNLFPPQGLDWAIFEGKLSDPNVEGSLFEAIIGCLGEGYTMDPKQVYVAGFSAGAITTNMLASRYQSRVAASLAFSGAWFNDPAETATINTSGFNVTYSWEPLVAPASGMVLITHGGANDTFGPFGQKVIDFELCAQKAEPFLLGAQRSYIDCAHTKGHQPHPEVTAELAFRYFKAHRAGEPSPYLGGKLPADFPASCTLREP